MRRRLPALLAVLAVAAWTGGSVGAGGGTATVWITRDRGATVLVAPQRVPAGETAMEALRRVARVGTRYGGRYVQSVNGIEGSLSARQDWLYTVNGYEADVGATDYRLHPGDVEWWDFRHWGTAGDIHVVSGAFPEPFLHGYGGKVRPAAVRYRGAGLAAGARAIAALLHGKAAPEGTAVPDDANLFLLLPGPPRLAVRLRSADAGAGSPVELDFAGDAARLARDPASIRYRFGSGE